jgi:tail tube protein
VDSSYVSGTTVPLDTNTKINYRHESGEDVKETDPTGNWFKLGNVRTFTPSGGRELQRSQALSGSRVLSNFREGNYDAGADMTVELDIETAGLFYLHALNNDYYSAGTTQPSSPVNTTLANPGAKGDTQIEVADATNMATGVFLLVGTGTGAEIVKVGTYTSGTTIDLDPDAHPYGLRKSHAGGVAVVEKIKPFTHTIYRGSSIPEGISILLRFTDIESLMLIRGNKISNLTLNVDPSDLPQLNMTVVGKAFQILSENIFGTPTAISNTPYVHWEADVQVDGSPLTTNQLENLSLVIENTIQANFVVGSPIKGAITPGEGSVSGSFTYQFGSQQFSEKTVAGTETQLDFIWTYIGDDNHQVTMSVPKAKFEGTPHPGVGSKDPITDDKSFLGRLDTGSSPNTDITVTVKNNQPTVEFMVE